ncbi:MAG: HNH endonuclease [Candidatus Micrarchaeia archaeon]|jgi:predicted restriction endonuclease
MSISKKIRFEVFKRDGFQCCYCGKTPPEVVLEIDHIDPKSKGGKDSIENLLTACFDCNRGKRDIPLDKAPSKLSENLEVLKLKEEQLKEYRKFVKKVESRLKNDMDTIEDVFQETYPDRQFTQKFRSVSLKRFLSLLPVHVIQESMAYACSRIPDDSNRVIPYFCGICWRKIRGTNLYPNE